MHLAIRPTEEQTNWINRNLFAGRAPDELAEILVKHDAWNDGDAHRAIRIWEQVFARTASTMDAREHWLLIESHRDNLLRRRRAWFRRLWKRVRASYRVGLKDYDWLCRDIGRQYPPTIAAIELSRASPRVLSDPNYGSTQSLRRRAYAAHRASRRPAQYGKRR